MKLTIKPTPLELCQGILLSIIIGLSRSIIGDPITITLISIATIAYLAYAYKDVIKLILQTHTKN